MPVGKNERPLLEFTSAAEWRDWLAANHATSDGAWVALAKKHRGAMAPSYEEAVEEALCWGWIDTTARKLDAERYLGLFTPRKPRGTWSPSNKQRIERLIAAGRMQPPGLAAIEAAKANGSWRLLDDVEALVIPEDLRAPLVGVPALYATFDALGDSQKKMVLFWIASAKRPETRAARIARTLEALRRGEPPV